MIYTEIKGLKISKITLGTVALGIDYGVFKGQSKPDKNERSLIIASAIKAGINSFDTAREYGDAESLIGGILPSNNEQNRYNIATKFKISDQKGFNYDSFRAEAYESALISLKNLSVQQIPIYLFHMVSSFDILEVMKFLPKVLRDLKKDGLIKTGGISIDHPLELEHCIDYNEIEAIQLPMNVLDQRLIHSGLLDKLKSFNKIVFVRSVFLKGLFFRPIEELSGNLQQAGHFLQKLEDFAERSNMTLIQFAFSYIRDLEGITSILIGVEKEIQIKENLELLNGRMIPLEIREEAHQYFKNVPEEILTPRMWSIS